MDKYREYLMEKEKRIKDDNAIYFESVNKVLPNVFKIVASRFVET